MIEDTFAEKTKMLMLLHYSRLSERDRRQYAALESLKLGRGGTTYISKILGISRGTIIEGRKELTSALKEPVAPGKQRKAGGGRKKNRKKPGDKKFADRLD